MKLLLVLGSLLYCLSAFGAIEKEISHVSQATGNYVFIDRIHITFTGSAEDQCSRVSFSVYKDAAAYTAGAEPLIPSHTTVSWCGANNPLDKATIDAAGAAVTDGEYYNALYAPLYAKAIAEIADYAGGTLVP